MYSIEYEPAKPGQSAVYRHPQTLQGFKMSPYNNLQESLLQTFRLHSQKKTLGVFNENTRIYDQISYAEVEQIGLQLGSGLVNLNVIDEISDERGIKLKSVGIYMRNRREWTLIDIACQLYGLTSVPFYDSLGMQSKESVNSSLTRTNVKVIFVQQSTAAILSECDVPILKVVIGVEKISDAVIHKFTSKGIQYLNWQQILQSKIVPLPKYNIDTPLTAVFTSGTTGQPKVAIQTHKNMLSMIEFFQYYPHMKIQQNEVYLSFLPLPHTFERVIHIAMIQAGAEINFSSGDPLKLRDDIQSCRPTFLCAVPRILNRFYEAIQLSFNSSPQKDLIQKAIDIKLQNLHKDATTTHPQFDTQIFQKVKDLVGGRLRLIITGAAPISPGVIDYLSVCFCCPIIEGYGQTESTAASFLTHVTDPISGHVGGPTTSQEYKLVDVPDMNYFAQGPIPRGEVCLRGLSVFIGYFGDKERTNETIDAEGWVHTGDIGERLSSGALKLIDRKKNLFKLQQGEYVSPERIENCYVRAQGVSEVLVQGDPLKTYCVAVIVPEPGYLTQKAKELNIQGSIEELCKNSKLRLIILQNCIAQGVNEKLSGFEQIKNVHLESRPFMQVGILTETQKMQRHVAKGIYKEIIDKLYSEDLA